MSVLKGTEQIIIRNNFVFMNFKKMILKLLFQTKKNAE